MNKFNVGNSGPVIQLFQNEVHETLRWRNLPKISNLMSDQFVIKKSRYFSVIRLKILEK